jgi:hypothetical protein
MHIVRRGSAIALSLWLLLCAGCFPFFGRKGEPPRTPDAVVRFASAANALGVPPSPPPLPEVTRLLAGAVESLPAAPGANELGQKIAVEAQTMRGTADPEAARRSLSFAVQAIERMKKPAGSPKDHQQAIADVQKAGSIEDGYRAVARALLLFTGGPLATGEDLPALVARFAVEDTDAARRTGAQVLYALASALVAVHADPGDLQQRAQRLTDADPLSYTPQLRDGLAVAIDALAKLKQTPPAVEALRVQGHAAVQRITRDRPFELQRPVVQDALRLLSDAITVKARSEAPGR